MSTHFSTAFVNMLGNCEAPAIYLRWSAISMIGAVLGRRAYIQFGHSKQYANTYVFLTGKPGARKGTGMAMVRQILTAAKYPCLAPTRMKKEAMWEKLGELSRANGQEIVRGKEAEEVTFEDLLGDSQYKTAELFILADELTDLITPGDAEFTTNLTNMWDNLPHFDNRLRTRENIYIHEPTISILGATTPMSLQGIIPVQAIGGGFMRRLLLIAGEQTKKVTRPDVPAPHAVLQFVNLVQELQQLEGEEIVIPDKLWDTLLDPIYRQEHFLTDRRFESYVGVRFTHLLKLCLIFACARLASTVSQDDIIQANTVLSFAEMRMVQALGHSGIAKTSSIDSMILEALRGARNPPTLGELHKMLGADVGSRKELQERLKTLKEIERIRTMTLRGRPCYLAQQDVLECIEKSPFIDQGILTKEERL
jgi:Protein of unknown function (DUF3987)